MADLVLERDTDITHLDWVDDQPEKWSPEPFRWLSATALMYLANKADQSELSRGKPSAFSGSLFKQIADRVL